MAHASPSSERDRAVYAPRRCITRRIVAAIVTVLIILLSLAGIRAYILLELEHQKIDLWGGTSGTYAGIDRFGRTVSQFPMPL